MPRPTRLEVNLAALSHNLAQIKQHVKGARVIAMVKANAYGCGIRTILPVLDGQVDALGVACLEEALAIRALGVRTSCVLFQGVFNAEELKSVSEHQFACVIHQSDQLKWLVHNPLPQPISVWVKVNTGMHRLGFHPSAIPEIRRALLDCPWVNSDLGLMTHLACADEPFRIENAEQIERFHQIDHAGFRFRSMANSAALLSFPDTHLDVVRPGIMLYGVSPFANALATDLGLIPVMRFVSAVTAIHQVPAHAKIGYGSTWTTTRPSVIGVVAAGYGDGYPRHIQPNTPVWIKGRDIPIVGRVSMDMLTVDLTDHTDVAVGDRVELWGDHLLVERVAQSANTIGYELLCQISDRVRSVAR